MVGVREFDTSIVRIESTRRNEELERRLLAALASNGGSECVLTGLADRGVAELVVTVLQILNLDRDRDGSIILVDKGGLNVRATEGENVVETIASLKRESVLLANGGLGKTFARGDRGGTIGLGRDNSVNSTTDIRKERPRTREGRGWDLHQSICRRMTQQTC